MAIRRQPTDEEIAARAHELYEQRGRTEGHDVEDWMQAKSELEAAEVSAETDDVEAGERHAAAETKPDARPGARRTPTPKPKRR